MSELQLASKDRLRATGIQRWDVSIHPLLGAPCDGCYVSICHFSGTGFESVLIIVDSTGKLDYPTPVLQECHNNPTLIRHDAYFFKVNTGIEVPSFRKIEELHLAAENYHEISSSTDNKF